MGICKTNQLGMIYTSSKQYRSINLLHSL